MTLPDPETPLVYSLHYTQDARTGRMSCPPKRWGV